MIGRVRFTRNHNVCCRIIRTRRKNRRDVCHGFGAYYFSDRPDPTGWNYGRGLSVFFFLWWAEFEIRSGTARRAEICLAEPARIEV